MCYWSLQLMHSILLLQEEIGRIGRSQEEIGRIGRSQDDIGRKLAEQDIGRIGRSQEEIGRIGRSLIEVRAAALRVHACHTLRTCKADIAFTCMCKPVVTELPFASLSRQRYAAYALCLTAAGGDRPHWAQPG